MRMKITAKRELKGEEGLQVRRGLQLALSRFEGLISMVTVVVGDPAEANVRLRLRLRTGESITTSERNPDVAADARQAAQRAASVLDRTRGSLRAPRMARISETTQRI